MPKNAVVLANASGAEMSFHDLQKAIFIYKAGKLKERALPDEQKFDLLRTLASRIGLDDVTMSQALDDVERNVEGLLLNDFSDNYIAIA